MTWTEYKRTHPIEQLFNDGRFAFLRIGDCINLSARTWATRSGAQKARKQFWQDNDKFERLLASREQALDAKEGATV